MATRLTQKPASQLPFFSSSLLSSSSVSSYSASLFPVAISLHTAVDCSYSLSISLCFVIPASITTHKIYAPSDRNELDWLRRPTRYVNKAAVLRLPLTTIITLFPSFHVYNLVYQFINVTDAFIKIVANFGLYATFKHLVKCQVVQGPHLRSCLKNPVKKPESEAKLANRKFLDSVKAVTKTVKKTIAVLTGKTKKVKIQATPTKSLVVFRWIDNKKDCFHQAQRRRRAPKHW